MSQAQVSRQSVEEPRALVLSGARVAIDSSHALRAALFLREGKIEAILPGEEPPAAILGSAYEIDLKDHLILPGLINVHDHLHFGLFPRLGRGPYPSWREWANDIHRPNESPLRELLEIPKETRLWWGILRNLLSGATTVCHHDAAHPLLSHPAIPLTVHSAFGWAHSLDDPQWKESYARTPEDWPFIVHCAEGLDSKSRRDAAKFRRAARLDDRAVFVHAVGIPRREWMLLRAAGVWIVWCPTSNLHILGRTLPRDLLLDYPSIALGSDSPISGAGDLLDELQAARAVYDLPPDLLYRMVTTRPARLLRLPRQYGSIAWGGPADLLIVRDTGQTPSHSLATLSRSNIAALLHKGIVRVSSSEFYCRHRDLLHALTGSVERRGFRWHVAVPPEMLAIDLQQRSTANSGMFAEVTNQ
jgi:cytosine/adenosine deaminase-related metal-dependent hydrolase